LGRYLGAQKSKEIKTDLNYENMFLVTYACPRCSESFQKRPWVTIRDCNKCKIKFRE
jgi:ribosomal protein L37AE/L43A